MSAEATEAARLKTWRVKIFLSSWLCYVGYYFARKSWGIVKAALDQELGFGPEMLGWIEASYLVAYALGQFLAGWAGRRWGPRAILLVGMAVSVGAHTAFGFVNNPMTFAAFMFVNGLAQATGWPGCVGTMANWFRREERGVVMGFWCTNYQVGGVLAKGLATLALGALAYRYRYAFFSGSAVLLLVWLVVLVFLRNKPEDVGLPALVEEEIHQSPGAVGWSRGTWTSILLVGAFYFFVKFIRYALDGWVPYLFSIHHGLEYSEAGFLSLIFDLFGVAGVIFIGWISDRFFHGRRAKISFFMVLCMVLSCLLLLWAGPRSVFFFAVGLAAVGFTLFGPDSLMSGAAAIDIGTPQQATLAAGIINGMGSIGAIFQAGIIGTLLARSGGDPTGVFVLLVLAALAAALCLGAVLVRNRLGRSDI